MITLWECNFQTGGLAYDTFGGKTLARCFSRQETKLKSIPRNKIRFDSE